MKVSERNIGVNLHSGEKGKIIDKDKILLGEIAVNTNPEEPFISFRASGVSEDKMVTTVVSAKFTTDAIGEPTVRNGVLTIPIPKGAQGLQGEKGPQGARGETGDQGPQGNTGGPGPKGPQGNMGKTGDQGAQGERGSVGSYGSTGNVGTKGAQGAQGERGSAGSFGSTGNVGTKGAQGAQGAKGSDGSFGSTGDKGTTGIQGAQGSRGNTGSYGSKGDSGHVGAQGAQGGRGTVGSYGSTGDRGHAGAQGAQGTRGAIGATGEIVTIGKTNNNSNKTYVISHTDGTSESVSFAQNEWYRNTDIYIQSGAMHAQNGFYQDSDVRLKNFGDDIGINFDSLANIPKKYFEWKDDKYGVGRQIGTSAQVLQRIYPELVTRNDDGYYTVNYAGLSIVALAAIDKLWEEIKRLKAGK